MEPVQEIISTSKALLTPWRKIPEIEMLAVIQ
jgi:hypothetical protein